MENVDISIIIVHYNTPKLTEMCLDSVIRSDSGDYTMEIIVVDNGDIPFKFQISNSNYQNRNSNIQKIIFHKNVKNLGFAGGNNVGIKKAKGRYILLLNSDTEVERNTIKEMIAFMDTHPNTGAGTCNVLLPSGLIDPACHRGFPTPWAAFTYFLGLERLFPNIRIFSHYHQWYKKIKSTHQIDSPSGAFMIVRKQTINDVGVLDENFFMYGEDIDWAYRMKQKGWKIYFYPHVSILHKKKQSGRSHPDSVVRKRTQQYFIKTMRLFYEKHYEKKNGPVISNIVKFGIRLLSYRNR